MTQEIITYIIVGIAVLLALYKMVKTIAGKKKKKSRKSGNFRKVTLSTAHNCSDCIAECSLRDAVPAIRKDKEELCETTVIKATDS